MMKIFKKRYLVLIVSFFIANVSLAQNPIFKNEVGINIGYSFGAYKNLTLSPVSLYEYSGITYDINYLRHTKKQRIVEVRFRHWDAKLKSEKIPELNLDYSGDRLDFNYLYPVINKNKWTIHSGIFTQSISALFENEIILFEMQQKLAFAGRFKYNINNKQVITSQLSIPFLLFVGGNLDLDFYLINKYQGYLFSLDYQYLLSNRFSIVLQYYSRYDKVQASNIYRELQNQITIGTNFKF